MPDDMEFSDDLEKGGRVFSDQMLEIRKHLRSERIALLAELTKGLIAVNSGGVIALLAFVGTLAKEPKALAAFSAYGYWGFVFFAIAIVASLFIPVFLVEHSISVKDSRTRAAYWWKICSWLITGVAFAMLILGMISVAWGLSSVFDTLPK
jgi:hypothetical protein